MPALVTVAGYTCNRRWQRSRRSVGAENLSSAARLVLHRRAGPPPPIARCASRPFRHSRQPAPAEVSSRCRPPQMQLRIQRAGQGRSWDRAATPVVASHRLIASSHRVVSSRRLIASSCCPRVSCPTASVTPTPDWKPSMSVQRGPTWSTPHAGALSPSIWHGPDLPGYRSASDHPTPGGPLSLTTTVVTAKFVDRVNLQNICQCQAYSVAISTLSRSDLRQGFTNLCQPFPSIKSIAR